MVTYDFSGKVAFVTGAAHGVGRRLAQKYAENGADVVVLDIGDNKEAVPYDLGTPETLEETVREVEDEGREALSVLADVSVEAEVEAAVREAIEQFGRIDILANNAGIVSVAHAVELPEETWDAVIDTNLKGVWLCSKHVGKHFLERGEGGTIVSNSSSSGMIGSPRACHYVASKHGIVGLTKALAIDLAEHDVNVNCVGPSFVVTPMVEGIVGEYGWELQAESRELSGVSSLFDPDVGSIEDVDVAEAFMWLSSDAARYVTGTFLPVDAGMLAK